MPATGHGCKSWYIEFGKFVKNVTKALTTFIKTLIQLWKNLIEFSQKVCVDSQGWGRTVGKPSYWWVQWSSGRGNPVKEKGKVLAILLFLISFCKSFSFHSFSSVAPLSASNGVGWETSLQSFGSQLCSSSYHLIILISLLSGGEDDDGGGVLVPGVLASLPHLLHHC